MDNKQLLINKNNLFKGLVGALLISLGLIFSEKSIEIKSSNMNIILGPALFLIGWGFFLSTQDSSVRIYGIIVLVIAMIGQIYMGWVLKKSQAFRLNNILYTMMFWVVFMMAWIIYVYKMSEGNNNRRKYIYTGLLLVMLSMVGYFFYRKHDWHTLTGGLIPSIMKNNSIFNQFVILFPFGWSLLAIGNAIN